MSETRHARVSEILADALELTPEERRPHLDRACDGEPDLRAEVESLLEHDRWPAAILDRAAPGSRPTAVPARIGPYHVLEKLGEGGMGVVYRAEQRLPIHREVALKRIRTGFETQQVLARFELERQSLARMDHPNIARVIDAGSTDDGLPYFAMEYVRGDSMTRYCDRRSLSLDARIRMFLDVCEGVQHAHRHGIIHRDLKPSNILVAEIEGRPTPKIIDFGVAKALERDPGRAALVTAAGQLLGTPEYMSPEQAAGSAAVDTRADVYALGAVLYELLVGSRPHATDEGDPLRPSVRLAALGPTAAQIAGTRASTPRQLSGQVRGDLDWIVMKALERERDRRYGSVTDLARDLQRHLANEPVTARPPTMIYRTRKLARRHRTAVALIAVLLPVGLVFAGALAGQTRQASLERERFDQMGKFLIDLFQEAPEGVSGRAALRSPKTILTDGLERIETDLDDPLVQSRTYAAIGRALISIGSIDSAETATARARAGLAGELGPEHPETLAAQVDMARVRLRQGRFDAADGLLVHALEAQRRVLGERHPQTLDTLLELGHVRKLAARNVDALPLFEEAVQRMTETHGGSHPRTLLAKSLLASVHLDLRRLDEAQALLEFIHAHMASLPEFERGPAIYNRACVRALRGDREGAIDDLREAIDRYGFLYPFAGDPNLSPLFEDPEFNEMARRARTTDPLWRESRRWRANRLVHESRHEEAEALAQALFRDARGVIQIDAAWDLATGIYLPQGRYAEAERYFVKVLDAERRDLGEVSSIVLSGLAVARFRKGDLDAAREAIDEAIRISGSSIIPDPEPSFLRAVRSVIDGDDRAAVRHLTEAYNLGFYDAARLELGRPFARLHGDPEFQRLRRRIEERAEYP